MSLSLNKIEMPFFRTTRKFTMDVIASTAFGLRLNSQEDKDNVFVTNSKRLLNFSLLNPLILIRRKQFFEVSFNILV